MMHRFQKLAERAAQVLGDTVPHVPSPCVSVCVMHPHTGLCEGCLRTLSEIGDWSRLSDDDKRGVWQRIQWRLSATVSN
jgi:predicted Fe-S protein YdhL (DUF1289 family)